MARINNKVKDHLDTKVQYIKDTALIYMDLNEIINFMINDIFENSDSIEELNYVLRKGFQGYENFTIKELVIIFAHRKNQSNNKITNLRVKSGKRWVKVI